MLPSVLTRQAISCAKKPGLLRSYLFRAKADNDPMQWMLPLV